MTTDLVTSAELTFLFTDMEASTRAWDRDVAAMDLAQQRHDTIVRRSISAHNGRIFSTAGDGMAAAFNRADEAVAAAVDAQRSLLGEPWPNAAPVRVRMGLHTGFAIERDGDYFGPTVIRAARLMSLVDGGRIICSTATGAALDPGTAEVELLPVGTVQLRGLAVPEAALAVRAPGIPEAGVPVDHARAEWRRPAAVTSLIARDELVADIAAQVTASVVVTLVGMGGIGKTRLATAVADRIAPAHREQVAWIDLAASAERSEVLHEMASLFGVRAQRGEHITDKITDAIGDRDLVLVLDNCEHVLEPLRPLVRLLLERCSGLAVLATSREQLALPAERVVVIGPLAAAGVDSAGVELLIERAGASRDDLEDVELAALAEIAERLDGIPLALELVAARCRRLGIVAVAQRLPVLLDQLSDPAREPRHQTLDRTIDWSYSMLSPAEQALLRLLAVFNGSFDLPAVEALAPTADVDATMTSLIDKSLVARQGRRFRLLEVTRTFAARRLAETTERQTLEAAHTSYVTARVVEIRQGLHGRDEAVWVDQLDALWPDVRAAVRRALDDDDATAAIELVTHLAFEAFWRRPEAFAWIDDAAVRWAERPGPRHAALLGAAGLASWTQLDVPEGIRLGTAALAADLAPGSALDCLPEGAAIGALAFAGRFEEAAAVARRTLPTLAAGTDHWNLAVMHANVANILGISGIAGPGHDDFERAVEDAMAVAYAIGNPTAIAYAHLVDAFGSGAADPARTRAALETARAHASEVNNRWILTSAATAVATAPPSGESDETALNMAFDAAAELSRTGWTIHAWCAMWGVIAGLAELDRCDAAALVLGGCEASGVARLAYQHIPDGLQDDSSSTAAYRRLGRHLPLDDLLAIASGRQRMPRLPSA